MTPVTAPICLESYSLDLETFMCAAAVQPTVHESKTLSLVEPQAPIAKEMSFTDEHPFGAVGIFIVISFLLATAFVGWIAAWLYAIRFSGVMSVKL